MMRSLWSAATGMTAQQTNIDVISNNLANVNTTSFKKSRAEFEDLMYQTMRVAGSATEGDNSIPVGLQVGMGVRPVAVHKFFTQGDFQNTGNPLDVAIEGDGFFRVMVGDQEMYTRCIRSSPPPVWTRGGATSTCPPTPRAIRWKACPVKTMWEPWLRVFWKCQTWRSWTKWST